MLWPTFCRKSEQLIIRPLLFKFIYMKMVWEEQLLQETVVNQKLLLGKEIWCQGEGKIGGTMQLELLWKKDPELLAHVVRI